MKRTEIPRETYEALRDSKADVKLEMETSYWLLTPGNGTVRLEDCDCSPQLINPAKASKAKKKASANSGWKKKGPQRTIESKLMKGPRWGRRHTLQPKSKAATTVSWFDSEFKESPVIQNGKAVKALSKDTNWPYQRATSAISYLCQNGYLTFSND